MLFPEYKMRKKTELHSSVKEFFKVAYKDLPIEPDTRKAKRRRTNKRSKAAQYSPYPAKQSNGILLAPKIDKSGGIHIVHTVHKTASNNPAYRSSTPINCQAKRWRPVNYR